MSTIIKSKFEKKKSWCWTAKRGVAEENRQHYIICIKVKNMQNLIQGIQKYVKKYKEKQGSN